MFMLSKMFWLDNPKILFDKDLIMDFFPSKDQEYDARLNSLVRLGLYISIVLAFYHKKLKWFYIFAFIALFTIILKRGKKINHYESECKGVCNDPVATPTPTQEEQKCTTPTLDNPFMNVTMKDYLNIDPKTNMIVNRPPACDVSDSDVKKNIDKNFDNNLYKDVNDIFGKMNSQRQFYTMPSTTIPNDQDAFAKWLYLSPKTCKEDQDYCLRYEDVRAKRFDFPEPEKNPVVTK